MEKNNKREMSHYDEDIDVKNHIRSVIGWGKFGEWVREATRAKMEKELKAKKK